MMSPEARQKIQFALRLALVVAVLRAGYIVYQRHEDKIAADKQKQAQNVGYSNPDYYVNPKKLYPYDLKSAKQLTQQPVWVKDLKKVSGRCRSSSAAAIFSPIATASE